MHFRAKHGWRGGLLACALAALLAGCGSSSSSGAHSSSSTGGNTSTQGGTSSTGGDCGVSTINGVSTRAFCGTATGQASLGGTTTSWSKGDCESAGGNFAVSFGRVILGTDAAATTLKKQYDYLGVAVIGATKDGAYAANTILAVNYKGTAYAVTNAKITITNNLTKGTFTGTDLLTNAAVSGSFSC
jgi:hypothetical protein